MAVFFCLTYCSMKNAATKKLHWLCALLAAALVIASGCLILPFYTEEKNCKTLVSECEATIAYSMVQCRPADGVSAKYSFTQGCLYQNIYFIQGNPVLVFQTAPSAHSFENMLNRDDFGHHFRPTILVSPVVKELCSAYCIRLYDDVSVMSDIWLGNIGHALFDSVYAIFVGLIEQAMHLEPFRVINARSQRDDIPWIHDIVDKIAPLGMVRSSAFFYQQGVDVIHLRKLLVPDFARCISCTTSDSFYGMPMGYELDAFRLLRQHLLVRFSLPPTPPRLMGNNTIRAIAVHNKRFTHSDYLALTRAFEDVSPSIVGRLVDWRDLGFRDQLRLLSATHIHLSAPGTGMLYQPFLPDGAVHVNLGACSLWPYQSSVWGTLLSHVYAGYADPIPGYMEQSMVASTPYHRALYYPLQEVCGGLQRERLHSLITDAARIYKSQFAIPVPRGINLAPDGRVVQSLLRADPLFREYISDPVAHQSCASGFYFWPEIIVRMTGGWATGECRYNKTLLLALRASELGEHYAQA